MAEFCKGCPDAGNCTGPIESFNSISSTTQGTVTPDRLAVSISFRTGYQWGQQI